MHIMIEEFSKGMRPFRARSSRYKWSGQVQPGNISLSESTATRLGRVSDRVRVESVPPVTVDRTWARGPGLSTRKRLGSDSEARRIANLPTQRHGRPVATHRPALAS